MKIRRGASLFNQSPLARHFGAGAKKPSVKSVRRATEILSRDEKLLFGADPETKSVFTAGSAEPPGSDRLREQFINSLHGGIPPHELAALEHICWLRTGLSATEFLAALALLREIRDKQ